MEQHNINICTDKQTCVQCGKVKENCYECTNAKGKYICQECVLSNIEKPKNKEKSMPKIHIVYGEYTFTEEELKEMSQEMARDLIKKKGLEDKKKSVTSQLKAEVDGVDAELNGLAEKIRTGSEYRNIKCTVKYLPEKEVKEFYSVEDGTLVDTKKMEGDDFQLKLNLDGTPKDNPDKNYIKPSGGKDAEQKEEEEK